MATKSVPGVGRYVPGYFCIASRVSRQQQGLLCRSSIRYEELLKVQWYHLWCWFCAGSDWNFGRMEKASPWPCQRDWLSNCRHHLRPTFSIISLPAPFHRHSARERVLRSWNFPEGTGVDGSQVDHWIGSWFCCICVFTKIYINNSNNKLTINYN